MTTREQNKTNYNDYNHVFRFFDYFQHWQVVSGHRMLLNRGTRKCLDAAFYSFDSPILYTCDWNGVIRRNNMNQLIQWDAPEDVNDGNTTGRIFVYGGYWSQSLTGTDIFPLQRNYLESTKAMCLAAQSIIKEEGEEKEKERKEEYAKVTFKPCSSIKSEDNDSMRFSPKWGIMPLSSRFGKRKFEDALTINDEFAKQYLGVAS